MSVWRPKRFWKSVSVEPAEEGFGVALDGRPVRTPAKAALILPTRAMAEAVAGEWQGVEGEIRPETMPVTRRANAAIDKVAPQFDEVAEMIAAYGGSDLLCYRAEGPRELTEAQARGWDPLLDWAEATFGARLAVTQGVVPVAQAETALERLRAEVRACSAFQLTALHDLVALTGSLVLGLAATRPEFEPEDLWALSRIDEEWQIAQWGEDEEAAQAVALRKADFLAARKFWALCGQ